MKNFALAATVIAVAVGLTLLQRVVATSDGGPVQASPAVARAQSKAQSKTIKGQVVSVDSSSRDNSSSRPRQAVVKLKSGETVQASVPDGCVVFAGQVAHLALADRGNQRSYTVQGTE
jgi:hypothetical protein